MFKVIAVVPFKYTRKKDGVVIDAYHVTILDDNGRSLTVFSTQSFEVGDYVYGYCRIYDNKVTYSRLEKCSE